MSLINDALRRAQANQPQQPTPQGGPELRPIDHDHTTPRHGGMLLPVCIGVAALIGLFGLWQVTRTGAGKETVEARALAPASPEVSLTVQPPPRVEPALAPPKAPAQASPAGALTPDPGPAGQPAQADASPPLKLQGIVFSRLPSAMISGQTVTPGDKIRGFVVSEIKADRVLLAGDGQTITLTLP